MAIQNHTEFIMQKVGLNINIETLTKRIFLLAKKLNFSIG
jgi:hypothetical protein